MAEKLLRSCCAFPGEGHRLWMADLVKDCVRVSHVLGEQGTPLSADNLCDDKLIKFS